MVPDPPEISRAAARRLAVAKQHLAGGALRRQGRQDIVSVLRDIVYVQIDTFTTVVPPHVIALWSRVDDFREADLERLLWQEKRLFQTSPAPISVGLVEDYPIYHSLMMRFPEPTTSWWGGKRAAARAWLAGHRELRESILRQLEGSELTLEQFEGHDRTPRTLEDGWTRGSDVALTLGYLHMMGEVMIVGRSGIQKVWGLPGDFLPAGVDRTELPQEELERRSAVRAVRALGAASPSEINYYFPRGRYLDLRGALRALEGAGTLQRVRVKGQRPKELRYVHAQDLPLLEQMEGEERRPRVALLSPFDNLIAHRGRTQELFDFDYTHGNYLPPAKRRYGVFVLPVLWGDRIIGRVDPKLDRARGKLVVNSVHAEPGAPPGREVARAIAELLGRFARFAGAREVAWTSQVPRIWKAELC